MFLLENVVLFDLTSIIKYACPLSSPIIHSPFESLVNTVFIRHSLKFDFFQSMEKSSFTSG